jgi:hypothetical protein
VQAKERQSVGVSCDDCEKPKEKFPGFGGLVMPYCSWWSPRIASRFSCRRWAAAAGDGRGPTAPSSTRCPPEALAPWKIGCHVGVQQFVSLEHTKRIWKQ